MSKQAEVASTTHLARVLETGAEIAGGYRHAPKHVTPGEPIEPDGAVLKWYQLNTADRPVPDAISRQARALVARFPLQARGLGFVILHRCGQEFYFLIVCSWRNSNELWQTVFYKDGDAMPDFQPFPRDEDHKPSLCVWELVPVWHEQGAWVRFLSSPRDEAAARAWLADRYAGIA